MSNKKIRGVSVKKYTALLHQIERAKDPAAEEAKLVKKGILLPSSKGIDKNRDNAVFSNRSKIKGRRRGEDECLVPHCQNTSSRRGLCNTHRSYAYMMIRKGKATERNLLSRGLLLPKASGGDQRRFSRKKAKKKTTKKTTKKRTIKRSKKTKKKKTASKKRSSKKKVSRAPKKKKKPIKRHSVIGLSFPAALLDSDICLYPKCKTTRKGGGRGLCSKHYSQYKRKRNKLSDRARKRLDKDLIKRHLLLPAKATILKSQNLESSAFEIGSPIRGSIRRW